jgi:aspartate/methionine/tyrosine aminotransferase
MTGWRLGYGVWPKDLVAHAERLQINSSSCANAATQVAAVEALRGPQDEVDRMLRAFDERRRLIHKELNTIPGFSCVMPKGAFYAFPNTSKTGIPSRTLEHEFLNEAGVACLSGTSFGKFGEGFLRFSYANSVDNIKEGLRRVREHLAKRAATAGTKR